MWVLYHNTRFIYAALSLFDSFNLIPINISRYKNKKEKQAFSEINVNVQALFVDITITLKVTFMHKTVVNL